MATDKVRFVRYLQGAPKDAVRLLTNEDADYLRERFEEVFANFVEERVPGFLRGAISVEPMVRLDCEEGRQSIGLRDMVIGYEKSSRTASGWNCWHIRNAATNLIEEVDEDGRSVFFKKATVLRVEPISERYPEFLRGAQVRREDDGSWSMVTRDGVQTGFPGQGYWVLDSVGKDGIPHGHILTKGTPSYDDFYACDEDGNILGRLCEVDLA
ncbi:hypothetical protein IIY24_01085 [Candidatus Saccharibacteria bacterium]|nr:hypothetical protein [Candidatus Saccharibacteria bacterium]